MKRETSGIKTILTHSISLITVAFFEISIHHRFLSIKQTYFNHSFIDQMKYIQIYGYLTCAPHIKSEKKCIHTVEKAYNKSVK